MKFLFPSMKIRAPKEVAQCAGPTLPTQGWLLPGHVSFLTAGGVTSPDFWVVWVFGTCLQFCFVFSEGFLVD